MTKDEYQVPGEVAVALSTGRVEMMASLVNDVGSGHRVLTPAEAYGVLRLLRDQIKYRSEDAVRLARFGKTVHVVDDAAKGLATLGEQLRDALRRIGSNEALEGEE